MVSMQLTFKREKKKDKEKQVRSTRHSKCQFPYPIGTGGYFSWRRRSTHKTDRSPSSSAQINKAWSYTSAPPYIFMA
jgi:hypothetical protein